MHSRRNEEGNASASHAHPLPDPTHTHKQHALAGRIKPSESFWTVEDGVLHLQLTKASPGEAWAGALADHALPPPAAEAERQRLLLERFQGEVRDWRAWAW
jgi:hypothetical protein